jgi:hypothetical protein
MLEIEVKYKINDYVNFIGQTEKLRVLWYDYIQDRWLRYILAVWQDHKYVYPSEIETYRQLEKIGFVESK